MDFTTYYSIVERDYETWIDIALFVEKRSGLLEILHELTEDHKKLIASGVSINTSKQVMHCKYRTYIDSCRGMTRNYRYGGQGPSQREQSYDIQLVFAFEMARRTAWFLTWNPGEWYSLMCSKMISYGNNEDHKATTLTGFFPSLGQRFIPNRDDSCFCDTFLQYMFGYTDLFDFGFYKYKEIKVKKGERRVYELSAVINTYPLQKEKLLGRYIEPDDNIRKNEVEENIEILCATEKSTTSYYTRLVEHLAIVGDYIRGGNVSPQIANDLKASVIAAAPGKRKESVGNDRDYFEFLEFIMELLGITLFVQPKILARIKYRNQKGEEIHVIDMLARRIAFDAMVGINKLALNAFKPSETLSQTVQTDATRILGLLRDSDLRSPYEVSIKINGEAAAWSTIVNAIGPFQKGKSETYAVDLDVITAPPTFYLKTGGHYAEDAISYISVDAFGEITSIHELKRLNDKVPYIMKSVGSQFQYYISAIVCHRKPASDRGAHWWFWARDPRNGLWYRVDDLDHDEMNRGVHKHLEVLNSKDEYVTSRNKIHHEMLKEIKQNGEAVWYTRSDVFEKMLTRFGVSY
jgi:hypothetical protein